MVKNKSYLLLFFFLLVKIQVCVGCCAWCHDQGVSFLISQNSVCVGCSAWCHDQGVQNTKKYIPEMWRFYHLDAKSRKTLFLVRNPLEGAQVSLWESPSFVPRDAQSYVVISVPNKLWIIMNSLEGGIPILQVHSSPKHLLERRQELFLPSTSAALALAGSMVGRSSGTAPSRGLWWFLLGLIPLCSLGGAWGTRQQLKNRLWKERLTC